MTPIIILLKLILQHIYSRGGRAVCCDSQLVLLVYYSFSGKTARVAKLIAGYIPCDTEQIITVSSYPLNRILIHRILARLGPRHRPVILRPRHKVSNYGTVIIGMPVWNNGIPNPMLSFLESVDWRGIRVYPFFTSGGLYVNALSQLQNTCKGAGITDPLYIIFDSDGNITDVRE